MIWTPERDLQFGIFRNKGQKLKYVIKFSTRTPVTLRAILLRVLDHLAKITSRNPDLHSKLADYFYPDHDNSHHEAGLVPSISPKMG